MPRAVHFLLSAVAVPVDPKTSDAERSPRLGDEWRDWDGSASIEATAPKRLFFALIWGFLAVAAGSSSLFWYMVKPRLAEWHQTAPNLFLVALGLLVMLLGVAMALLTLMLLTGWPRSAQASLVARRILGLLERRAFWLGRVLSINRDRLANAFIRTNNALVRLAPEDLSSDQVLLLLPRCLRKQQLEQARELAQARGVEVAVVAGGEQARQRIRDKRPCMVIGVACERDLLSGIRDMSHKMSVLGIANRRPDGPCRNTDIDLTELKAALDLCASPAQKTATAKA